MLDTETKRRIDTARDILVGKLPDPKSQVEQITIALIYKFMDDMDAQSVEYGGEPSFFVGDYEKYGWRKIFSPAIGGHEMLNLYGEAITSLNQNPNLPQLFRDVFKNAFLPYRDPETLKLFLKTINEFQYDHSERLGDAFEYLLSVLGSQGDAGQFRTPRHIIDFIVEVVQPRKDEMVCDPACGTAGFLISSYKHILKANTRKTPGDLLTPDERKKLITNFVGYDISPDMVRLSLVNMYLHGFPDPHIYEYDTLTSEDRWNEYFDVIMANPPFMSPKGGIKPHKKFSLQANRSEVLFADYIAEHINPINGRAGMIVPEGIIFQGANAYKALRKMLVEKNYIYAVVSLPAGVFNPYSGVKTSILFFDKTLAAKSDKILFVKINNDGRSLGAQRKEIKGSEINDAKNLILDFQKSILIGDISGFADGELPLQAFAVEKSRIAKNTDFSLSGDRYRAIEHGHSKYELVELGEVCEVKGGKRLPKGSDFSNERTAHPYLRVSDFTNKSIALKNLKYIDENTFSEIRNYIISKDDVYISIAGTIGLFGTIPDILDGANLTENAAKLIIDQSRLNKVFLVYIGMSDLVQQQISRLTHAVGVPKLALERIRTIKFPLPPLPVQKEIVERIESYQRLIHGAKQVVANFKPTINPNPDWQMIELGEVCELVSGFSFNSKDFSNNGEAKSIKITNVSVGYFVENNTGFLPANYADKYSKFKANTGDIVIALTRSIIGDGLKVCLVPDSYNGALVNQRVGLLKCNSDKTDKNFIFLQMKSERASSYIEEKARSLMQPNLSIKDLATFKIPLPPLEEQKQIVAQIEREQSLVNANKELIAIYEQKIKDEINRLWEP